MPFIIRSIITALAIWLTTYLPLDVAVTGGSTWWGIALVYLAIGAILVLVNKIVKPIVDFFTTPVRWLTLGLFSLIVNWAMLAFTGWITSKFDFGTLALGGFWKTLGAAVVIALTTWLLAKILPSGKRSKRSR